MNIIDVKVLLFENLYQTLIQESYKKILKE